jgi:hypothetical protein
MDIVSNTAITLQLTGNGINALDTGTLQANKVYALYVITSSAGNSPVYGLYSLNQGNTIVSPVMPTGTDGNVLDLKRKVGYFLTNSSSQIARFVTTGDTNNRTYNFQLLGTVGDVLVAWTGSTAIKVIPLTSVVPNAPGTVVGGTFYLQSNSAVQNKCWVSNYNPGTSIANTIPLLDPGISGVSSACYQRLAVDYTTGTPSICVQLTVTTQSLDVFITDFAYSV